MEELASYVDCMASASAKSALELQQATWQEKWQLDTIVKQQAARLQQQAEELDVLRSLAAQSHQQLVLSNTQDVQLQQQLEWHKAVSDVPSRVSRSPVDPQLTSRGECVLMQSVHSPMPGIGVCPNHSKNTVGSLG